MRRLSAFLSIASSIDRSRNVTQKVEPEASKRLSKGVLMGNPQSPDRSSIYEVGGLTARLAVCFSIARRAFAAGPEEAGFCPVTKRPSLTT